MATAVGPWQGSTPQGRIEVDYTVTRSADATSATVTAWFVLATDNNLFDSTNSWEVWGGAGSASGSNTNYSHSGGGRTGFCPAGPAAIGYGGMDVGARVTGLEGVGATVEAVVHLDGVPLAPFTDGTYYAYGVSATGFTIGNLVANGNGGTLIDVQAQVNTSAQEAGSTLFQTGAWQNIGIGGRTRYTTYYYRVRIANTTYGWGPWGPWKSVTTSIGVPSAPTGYSATAITQQTAQTTGISVSDNGGVALADIRAQLNTAQTEDGASVIQRGSWGDITFTGLLPGTTYYFRLQAANSTHWGAYGAWASFTTLPGVSVNINGVWKNAQPYVNINGVWKVAVRYVNINGVWKQ